MGPIALAARGLVRRFGRRRVIDGLDLTVHEGETYGFLGRNGAGKSTAIHLLLGILRPDGGEVELLGRRARVPPPAWRREVGFVAQDPAFDPWATALDLGRFHARFYPTWDGDHFQRVLSVLDVPMAQRSETLSIGTRTKLALALALAHRPRMLVLDEPTAGLDPIARREFQDIVRGTARTDVRTTFFSSHNIDDIARLADRVGILDAGRLRFEGSLDALTASVRAVRLEGWYPREAPPPVPPGFTLLSVRFTPAYVVTYGASPAAWDAAALPDDRVLRLDVDGAVVAALTPPTPRAPSGAPPVTPR